MTFQDMKKFEAWVEGRTGVPFVDANMRELKMSGWMSNRGRQNVASFLVKVSSDWSVSMILSSDWSRTWGSTGGWAPSGSSPSCWTTTFAQTMATGTTRRVSCH